MTDQLTEIVRLHQAYLEGKSGGVRADLRQANLSGIIFDRINLRSAALSGAMIAFNNMVQRT